MDRLARMRAIQAARDAILILKTETQFLAADKVKIYTLALLVQRHLASL
jgi:hypothetical protein